MLTALFAGLSIGLGSGVAPGPLTGMAISTTLRSGLGAGLRIAIAPLISDSVIIVLSLTLVSQLPDGAITILGIVGAIVVAAFGIEIL
jgi:threonine/homoserine/homoserine lactone efflux protein